MPCLLEAHNCGHQAQSLPAFLAPDLVCPLYSGSSLCWQNGPWSHTTNHATAWLIMCPADQVSVTCGPCCIQDLLELLQCLITGKRQPESALQQLDVLAGRHVEGLRGLTKAIQDARLSRNNDAIRTAIQRYDDALERYIPGLLAVSVEVLCTKPMPMLTVTVGTHCNVSHISPINGWMLQAGADILCMRC
eukprot:GHUV01032089.1.p1 GENE.GHUV01032089.1~~GHUV01032089.1.p1  ORF type:complete len:191 (-),score=33.54 GHUV01032089.1:923-1495(-)